jgi:chitodextrinase/flagellar hook assembly protein FlgD
LVPNRSYRFGVKAVYEGELKSAQTKMTAKTSLDKVLPTVPKGLTFADVTDSSLTLSWQAASDNDLLTGYEVFRNGKKIADLSAQQLSMQVTGLLPASKVSLKVKSVDHSGNRSPASTGLSVVTAADTQAPTKPLPVRVVDQRVGSVTVSWDAATDNKGVVRYDLYNYQKKFASTSSTRYTIRELPLGQHMELTVAAVDAAGLESERSNPVGALLPADKVVPTTPTAFGYTNLTSTGLSLRWQASLDDVGVTAYEVYRGDTMLGMTAKTAWKVTDLTASTEYTFRVRAVDKKGNKSDFTQTFTLTTPTESGSLAVMASITSASYSLVSDDLKAAYSISAQTPVSLTLIDSTGGEIDGEVVRTFVNNQTLSAGSKSVTLKLTDLPDGLYTLQLLAGGTISSQEVRVDRTTPVVAITNEPSNIRQHSHLRTTIIDYSLSEPAKVTVSLVATDGKLMHTFAKAESKPAGAYRIIWDGIKSGSTFIQDGSYLVRIEATDRSGFKATPASKGLRIDRLAPTAKSFTANQTLFKLIDSNLMTFKYELLEDAQVEIRVYNAAHHLRHTIVMGKQKKGKFTAVWDGKNKDGDYLSNQKYTYKLYLKDELNNEAEVMGGTFRLQREFH